MKRGKVNKNDAKSYRFEPSDVYEVTYIKAKHHEIGDKDYVSLPVAIMFINEGKMKVCQNSHLLFYAQSPDFHKLGLCYYLKILYL